MASFTGREEEGSNRSAEARPACRFVAFSDRVETSELRQRIR